MTRIDLSGSFDLPDPGATATFFNQQLGTISVTREPDLTPFQVLPGGPIRAAAAVCVHPNLLNNRTWMHTDAWFNRLLEVGYRTIRGLYNPSNAGCRRAFELCIEHGVHWIATIIPEDGYDWTKDQVQHRAKAVRDAITAGAHIDVELMNEPDHPRGSPSGVPADWPAIMVRHAEWIREILPDVWLVSCSLHAGADSFERDWQRLANAGLGDVGLIDSIGLHDYDNGYEPCQLTDWRIATARGAVGNLPVDITEYGHTTSINNPKAEHNPTSREAAALYAWRGHLDRHIIRGVRTACRFEFLDDPCPKQDVTEAGFGVVDTPTLDPATWTNKPEALALDMWLGMLTEPDPSFVPDPVRLRVVPSLVMPLQVLVTQTSGTTPLLWLWRPDTRVWDPEARQPITVDPVDVTVTTERDTFIVPVAGGMHTAPVETPWA